MRTIRSFVPVAQVLLLAPAILFMTSLLIRDAAGGNSSLAHMANQVVMWYSGRLWTLRILLISLPSLAVILGGLVMIAAWEKRKANQRFGGASVLILVLTLLAVIVLGVVGVHVLMN
jgi:hypothetical protein